MINRIRAYPPATLLALGCALSALATAVFAVLTDLTSHRMWAVVAAAGYLVAALMTWWSGRAAVGIRAAAVGAALVPAAVLIGIGVRQPEVDVIECSARVLLDTGSPYLSTPTEVTDVNPYLPGMALFGFPRLVFGDFVLGDARLWFLAAFAASFAAAVVMARTALPGRAGAVEWLGPSPTGPLWAALACPLIALPVAVGGHDLPVVGLMCLGLALAARRRPDEAGLVVGLATTLKQSAWPAVAVTVALAATLAGAAAARRCAAIATVTLAVVMIPVLAGPTGGSAFAQMAGFPLATTCITSPATSPTPGVLLASGGPVLRAVGFAVLALAVIGLTVALVRRPPRNLLAACTFLAVAETVAMLVLPTSRAGYLVYPVVLLLLAAAVETTAPQSPGRERTPRRWTLGTSASDR